ncbi:MAG: methyltransferase [Eubacteriaceae bacterium]|nr:methyltransferase [Eubacteriaceae bacterium]
MYKKIPFDEKELQVIDTAPGRYGGPATEILNKPATGKENYKAFYEMHPYWAPNTGGADSTMICPAVIPDNVGRHFVFDATTADLLKENPNYDGVDMFGIPWKYVPQVGGSMEDPAYPHPLEDANDWEKVLKFPNIDDWDWEGSAEINKDFLKPDKWNSISMLNGAYFERLISFMGFENAVVALIDEDQQSALHDLFEATTELYIKLIDKCIEAYPLLDCINVHDDWGSQQNPFFSMDTAMEMIVPHGKKLTDHIKSKGLVADLHSCGHNEARVEAYIAMGWQSWSPQPMNDTVKLYNEYGDKILIGVTTSGIAEDATEEEQDRAAKEIADKFCVPGKPASFRAMGPAYFQRQLYKYSRINFSK